MRRQRLMSRQEILLRETVRRIVAEADSPPASKKEVVPSDPAEFLDWLMSTGPAYANAVDEREGFSLFLALLETATDATGIGLNYVDDSPNWVGAWKRRKLRPFALWNWNCLNPSLRICS